MSSQTEEELNRPSPYDNSVSFLYKQAVRLEVPHKYVIIRLARDLETRFVDTFDLDEYQDLNFTTIFQVIHQLLSQDNSMTVSQIWDIVSKSRGDTFDPFEIIPIWLHSVPNFTSEEARNNYALYQQVQVHLTNIGYSQQFNNMGEVIDYYRTVWLPSYQAEYQRDLQTLQGYIRAQQEITGIVPLHHSEITVESVIISYDYPVERGINPLPDIFDTAQTSYVVPFIEYNVKSIQGQLEQLDVERFYRIYRGRSIDTRPDYNNVILRTDQAPRGETIYLNVWQDPDTDPPEEIFEEARLGKKEGFGAATLSYLSNGNSQGILRMTFSAPITESIDETTIMQRIHAHLPMLPVPQDAARPGSPIGVSSQINEIRISGSFVIYGTDLIHIVLFHIIMNDPIFSTYLYLDENSKSYAEKSRINIHYRGISTDIGESRGAYQIDANGKKKTKRRSAVSARMTYQIIPAGENYSVQNPDGTISTYTADQQFSAVIVRMTRASSRRVANQFLDIMARLFRRYLEQGNEIIQTYQRFVPEYRPLLVTETPEASNELEVPAATIEAGRIVEPAIQSKIEELQRIAPDIFVKGYARKCQKSNRQPLPIRQEEISAWQNHQVNVKGVMEPRQILAFPKDQPRIYLVCPDDMYPYPGVISNKTLSNRHEFPYLPCCFSHNQFTKVGSHLTEYLRGTTREVKTTGRASHVFKTPKIAESDRRGSLNTILSSFLPQYDPDEAGEFQRYGVPRSVNSFIHCVALALENREYLSSPDREQWTNDFRARLFNHQMRSRQIGGVTLQEYLLPEFLRQELYDMSNEDIVRAATNNDEFFDPLLYYRALEALFNCTIYVFPYTDQDKSGRRISMMHLPRHRYFHAHPPVPDKPVILILRHWGGEANALEFPQCELIIEQRATETRMVFGDSMNKLLYGAISFVGRTISWQIYESNLTPILTARMNIYSAINYQLLFGEIPVEGQVIDSAGKARLFVLAPEFGNSQQTLFSPFRIFVNVLPTAPLNVPEYDLENAIGKLPPYQRTIELFGDPISATTSIDGRLLTGLWFPIGDIQFGFYTPVTEVPWEEIIQRYPNLSRNSEMAALTVDVPRTRRDESRRESPIQRIKYLSRVARFIDQIVKYIYLVAGRPDNIYDFLSSIAILVPSQLRGDSVQMYDISRIQRILPLPRGDRPVESILQQLAVQSPSMFYQNRLLIYDEQMLWGLVYQLRRFVQSIDGVEIDSSQLRSIQSFYSTKEDFRSNPQTEFLLGTLREFNLWLQTYVPSPSLQQRTIQNLKENIQIRLNPNASPYQEPYIYQHTSNNAVGSSYDPRDDKFYLIQNVAGGDLRRAIQVAYTWHLEKRNTGYRTEPYEGPEPSPTRQGEPIAFPEPIVVETPGQPTITIAPSPPGAEIIVTPPTPAVEGLSSTGYSVVPEQRGALVTVGQSPVATDVLLPVHIIYRISPGGGIIIQTNNSGGQSQFLEILDYGNGTYAAMLPIL